MLLINGNVSIMIRSIHIGNIIDIYSQPIHYLSLVTTILACMAKLYTRKTMLLMNVHINVHVSIMIRSIHIGNIIDIYSQPIHYLR